MRLFFASILAVLFVTFACSIASANTLGAGELTVRVVQTGNIYVQEPVAAAAVTIAIPQNTATQTLQRFSVSPDVTELVKDPNGNSLLKIMFSGLQTGTYNYTIETIVKTDRKDVQELELATSNDLLGETEHVRLSDRIRELAWRYRGASDLGDVARIAMLANALVKYDAQSKPRTSQTTLQAGSGDGTAHAILLAALLKAAGVPTRIAVGDAWLPGEDMISNHAWVEVLAIEDGKEIWVPFDSAFLRGPSASYIVKWEGPDLPPERIEFFGGGDVSWQPSPDRVEILDSVPSPQLELAPIESGLTFPRNLYGWFGVTLKPKECGFWHLTPLSCVNAVKQPVLAFHANDRVVWSCNATSVIWTFGITGTNYVCPVRVDEEKGASTMTSVSIDSDTPIGNISISGPASVAENTLLNLVAVGIDPAREGEMLFYSPTLNERNAKSDWRLQLGPGLYDFYLWFDGSLATKTVRVLENRAFSIAMSSQDSVTVEEPLNLSIDVTNLLGESVEGVVKLKADNMPANFCWHNNITECSSEYPIMLKPHETRTVEFTTSLDKPGAITLAASIENSRISSAAFVSKAVQVMSPSAKQVEESIQTVSKVAKGVLRGIRLLPRMTYIITALF